MMNTWWFKLYTLKSIKWSFLCMVGLLIFDFLLPKDSGDSALLFTVSIVGFSFYKMTRPVVDLVKNYTFFQNTFSINEVVKMLLLNVNITLIVFYISLSLTFLLTQISGGGIGLLLLDLVDAFSAPIITVAFIFGLLFLNYVAISIPSERERHKRGMTFSQRIINLFGSFVLLTFVGVVFFQITAFGFHHPIFIIGFFGAFSISFIMQELDFLRWKKKTLVTFTGILKGLSVGFSLCIPLFMFATYLSGLDFDNERFSAEIKASRYEKAGPFVSLNRETLLEIEPFVKGFDYRNLDFDLNQEGPAFFSTPKRAGLLVNHLRQNKASDEFLISLYDDFQQNQDSWVKLKNLESIKTLSFHAWPKDKVLPERFIDLKQTTRDIASQKD